MIYLWYSQRAPTRPKPRGASEEARIKRAENWSKYLGFHWKWPGKRGENHRKPMGIWILKTWWNEFLAKFEINGNRCFFGGFSGDIIVDMEKKLLVGTKFQVQGEIQDHRRETYQDSWGATTITDQKRMVSIPIRSMYGIYGNIYHQYTPNVSIYIYHTWILWDMFNTRLERFLGASITCRYSRFKVKTNDIYKSVWEQWQHKLQRADESSQEYKSRLPHSRDSTL